MTSKPGKRSVDRVAADANVLPSAVAGKAALKVFTGASVQVFTTAVTLSEVREYLPDMARRYLLAPELLEGQLQLLPIQLVERPRFRGKLKEARRRIGARDPDDVDLLALALALDIPVWSNDNDFEGAGVVWYTTAELLKELRIR